MQTVVELLDVNGEWWTLAGPEAGDRGVYLGTGVTGLFDPPVKVVYEEPGNYPGARFLNARILRRDIVFGVEILNDAKTGANSWLSRDSEWRKAWSFERDCKLYVTTEDSGTRYLKLRLGESPDISLETDPNGLTLNRAAMVCIAGDPFWYEDDVVYSAVTEEDTTFDPNPLPWPWPQEALPTETLTIEVDPSDGKGGLNPTDQPVFLKWTVPGSTEAPAELYVPGIPWLGAPNSPACIWTIPDYSFEDEALANRRLRMPALIGGLRTNEVKRIFIDGRPTGGSFTLSVNSETTAGIAYNASTAAVKAALEALAYIAFDDVAVGQDPATNEVQILNIEGGPTGGTFTITFDGETTAGIAVNASALQVAYELSLLPNVGTFDINVSETVTNEKQEILLVGEPTGGTFTLTFDGQTTSALPWDANAFQVHDALVALSNIELFDISVNKNIFQPYSPYVIEFIGNLAGINLNLMSGDVSGLTGGAGLDITVKSTRNGSRPYKVAFQGVLGGFNLPQMTTSAAGLTGGVAPSVSVSTEVDGRRPYVVTFRNNLSGVDIPLMTIDASGLSGGTDPTGRVSVSVNGFTYPAENAVIDTDPRVEQVSSESGSPLWSRMNGVRFRHPIPPYTKSHTFEITVSGCVIGQMVTMRIPRPWTRPWGLE